MHTGTSQPTGRSQGHHAQGVRYAVLVASVAAMAVLAGCASRTSQAPVTDLSQGASTQAPSAGETHVVKPGDTLYKIAQAHGMDVATLSRLNNITDPTQLRVGQTLQLSGSGSAHSSASTSPVAVPVTPATQAEPSRPAPASDAKLIAWGWPASGKILQGFNANTKGIDIEGSVGDPVVAAAAGKVMYAGNGVRGLGNLVLVGHSNGFITAYAHNQSLLVKSGQQVKKGEKIALLGQSDTSSPRLHFEIRRSGTPVNPLSYLPPR